LIPDVEKLGRLELEDDLLPNDDEADDRPLLDELDELDEDRPPKLAPSTEQTNVVSMNIRATTLNFCMIFIPFGD
jgi:hypothetical protein